MVLLHLKNGLVQKLNPRVDTDLCFLDTLNTFEKTSIRRVALLDEAGRRTDLPIIDDPTSKLWIERLDKNGDIKGERVCVKTKRYFFKATLYYSDNRVVLDFDSSGGFYAKRNGF